MSVETVEPSHVIASVNSVDAGTADDAAAEEFDSAPIPLPRIELNPEQLQRIVEGALLAAGKPLAIDEIAALFDDGDRPNNDAIREALTKIAEQSVGRGFELREVASGFRFQVIQEVAPWIARLWEEKPQRYSRALLETLSLIAYRQPITRGDIEDIRGVAVASNIVKTLLERDWVRVVGHKDVPGRPALYATTRKFLDYFNLKNLDDLPTLAEIRDLDSLNTELALEGVDTVNIAEQGDAVAAEIAAINEIAGVAEIAGGNDRDEASAVAGSVAQEFESADLHDDEPDLSLHADFSAESGESSLDSSGEASSSADEFNQPAESKTADRDDLS